MSRSAVESHKGDSYQNVLVAQYVSEMVDESSLNKIERIEIESTRVLNGSPIEVDDFIIHYESGQKTYCQCKKNQSNRKSWSIHALGEELRKAWGLFIRADDIKSIDFYSQDGFGELGKLADESHSFTDLTSFIQSGIEENQTMKSIYQKLKTELKSSDDDKLWIFLKILSFKTPQREDIVEKTQLRLSSIATNANCALDAIMGLIASVNTRNDRDGLLSKRTPSCYITKKDVFDKFSLNGICLSPQYPLEVLQSEFERISSIGRIGFLREIGGERILRTEVNEILEFINSGNKTILLEGGAGSGKSCVLLDLVERMELSTSSQYKVIYLQTREFDSCANSTYQELGNDFVRKIARFAELNPVIIAMDSLDVIAISTGGSAFRYFSTLITQLKNISNVFVVASCRTFDSNYDVRLRTITWDKRILLKPWDWERDIIPLFDKWGWNISNVSDVQKLLLSSPYMLNIYYDLRQQGMIPAQSNEIDLLDEYLKSSLDKAGDKSFRERIETSLLEISLRMLTAHKMEILEDETNLNEEDTRLLKSLHILEKAGYSQLRFSHQTYLDLILVKNVIQQGKSLMKYAKELPSVPFVRPIIRTFFFYLRNRNLTRFEKELRGLLESEHVAFHLKRLVVFSLAEVSPFPQDKTLIRYLFQSNEDLFFLFSRNIKSYKWFQILREDWFDQICQTHDDKWIRWFARCGGSFYDQHPEEITDFWLNVSQLPWIDQGRLKSDIAYCLEKCRIADLDSTFILLQWIMEGEDLQDYRYLSISNILMKMPQNKRKEYDNLLFSFVANGCDHVFPEDIDTLQTKIRCHGEHFSNNHDFLENTINSLIISSIG